MNLQDNLFAGQSITIEISMDYLFEKTLELLATDLPKREETANFILGNFKEQNNLGQLFALCHNNTPSVPKFKVGDAVTSKLHNNSDLPYKYKSNEYHHPETMTVTSIDPITGIVDVKGTVTIEGKEFEVTGTVLADKLVLA